MSIDGLKEFLQTNALYNGYWIVETRVDAGPETVARSSIKTPKITLRVGASHTKEALHDLRHLLTKKLQRELIILIDHTHGKIHTCFGTTGVMFETLARSIPFKDNRFFHLSQIKDTEPLLNLFNTIFPDPAQ